MSTGLRTIERSAEFVLSAGVLASGILLLAGLLTGTELLLRFGVILLMATPVVRVVIVTLGLLHERDWLFSAVSSFVLSVLASGIYVAFGR